MNSDDFFRIFLKGFGTITLLCVVVTGIVFLYLLGILFYIVAFVCLIFVVGYIIDIYTKQSPL